MASSPLFSPSLISQSVLSSLPEGYTVRPLQKSDYQKGFLDVLKVLTKVGDISEAAWNERYDWMKAREGDYFILVVLNGGDGVSLSEPTASDSEAHRRIVGTGALVVERKFIHNLGLVGHIEDIAVTKDQQGKKLGLRIIQALDHVASEVGCYKVGIQFSGCTLLGLLLLTHVTQSILDCSEANEGFYVKCGFKRAGLEMAHYYSS